MKLHYFLFLLLFLPACAGNPDPVIAVADPTTKVLKSVNVIAKTAADLHQNGNLSEEDTAHVMIVVYRVNDAVETKLAPALKALDKVNDLKGRELVRASLDLIVNQLNLIKNPAFNSLLESVKVLLNQIREGLLEVNNGGSN